MHQPRFTVSILRSSDSCVKASRGNVSATGNGCLTMVGWLHHMLEDSRRGDGDFFSSFCDGWDHFRFLSYEVFNYMSHERYSFFFSLVNRRLIVYFVSSRNIPRKKGNFAGFLGSNIHQQLTIIPPEQSSFFLHSVKRSPEGQIWKETFVDPSGDLGALNRLPQKQLGLTATFTFAQDGLTLGISQPGQPPKDVESC